METKKCSVCKFKKPVLDFSRLHSSFDGLQYRCKICANKANKKTREKKPEYYRQKGREIQKRYRENNLESCKERSNNYKKQNKEKILRRGSQTNVRIGRWIAHTKLRSERNGWDFNLTKEYLADVWDNQKGMCALTGVLMNMELGQGRRFNGASIDRIDSSKGYIQGNVRFVCDSINTMKNTLSDEELYNWCLKLINYKRNGEQNIYIPNFSTFSDLVDRLVIDIHKLAYWENFKRQEHAKKNPDIEKINKADDLSRDCCEIRSALKSELNRMLSEIVNNQAYYPMKEVRTFMPASETIVEILADVSFESAMGTFKPEFIKAMTELLK